MVTGLALALALALHAGAHATVRRRTFDGVRPNEVVHLRLLRVGAKHAIKAEPDGAGVLRLGDAHIHGVAVCTHNSRRTRVTPSVSTTLTQYARAPGHAGPAICGSAAGRVWVVQRCRRTTVRRRHTATQRQDGASRRYVPTLMHVLSAALDSSSSFNGRQRSTTRTSVSRTANKAKKGGGARGQRRETPRGGRGQE